MNSQLNNGEYPADSLIPDSLIPDKNTTPEQKGSSGSILLSPKKKLLKTSLPENFGISDSVRKWALTNGYGKLDEHLEHFLGYVLANGKTYANWDQALTNAIREDWAKLRAFRNGRGKSIATDIARLPGDYIPASEKIRQEQRQRESMVRQ